MSLLLLAVGLVIAIAIVTAAIRVNNTAVRAAGAVVALAVMFVFVAFSSIRYVGEDKVGIIVKNFGTDLPPGQIIAVNGEKGPQAKILGPGWHFWFWPGLYDIEIELIDEITADEAGLLTTSDGVPLPSGEAFAPEWSEDQIKRMLDATHFLAAGGGYKGPQAAVLRPGKYRLNKRLYRIERVPVTNIEKATVGVVKSNVGKPPARVRAEDANVVNKGQRGIWNEPYTPQKLYLNTKAYEITKISTKQQIIRYGIGGDTEETEIVVRTSDGFTFPVDVRIEYQIRPEDAPMVVAELGDDQDNLRRRLASTVRAFFRNNAETVKALDYVNQRSQQETSVTAAMSIEMKKVGVTIVAVRIGDIAGDGSLAEILKTQTDRQIAVEEQETFETQKLAAEKKKELTRTVQEAEEEKRLATARYEVQIAEADKERKIIEAGAEAEAIKLRADAQAEAYSVIAEQIGAGNAAMVEFLKIVGEQGINITPRVMVVGGDGKSGGSGSSVREAETTALIGTMLDTMVREAPREDEKE